jgi:hypothetical protein
MTDNQPDRYPPTVKALLEKRGLLLQAIETHYADIAGLRNDVAAVNRVLETFGYNEDLDESAPKLRTIFFEKGQLARILADELRTAPAPMKTFDLATTVMEKLGLDSRDRKLFKEISHRTTNALRRMRVVGLVEAEKGARGALLWMLVRRTRFRG